MDSGAAGPSRWLRQHLPTRETLHENRLLRPFASQLGEPALWRLTRRSVPRAVALGLFVGVILPVMHMLLAALMAIPLRANVAITVLATLLINPLTIPPIYYAAYQIGGWELNHDSGLAANGAAEQFSTELGRILFWIHHASGPIALGILTIAFAASVIGYVITAIAWRSRLARRWRQRRGRSAASV